MARKNDIEMYSTHIEVKSVAAEKVIRIFKTKIYKYMTSVSENVCIDKLDDIAIIHTITKLKLNLLI